MENYERIQVALKKQADIRARIKLIPFNGYIEIKEIDGEKYLYSRYREGGKKKSVYLDVYSDERYQLLARQAQELRTLKRDLRRVTKELAELGYAENELSPRVLLNIDFARANVKSLIYDQAVLEGVSTTFPQTEAILENGIVNGVRAQDVQKILNLKHAWEFILDTDVLSSPSDYYILRYIAGMVNEGFYTNGGMIRSVPVTIGGTSYAPPLPLEPDVKDSIREILSDNEPVIDKAIRVALYCMKTQIFIDGNKRAAIIFANHFMVRNGEGMLVVPESQVEEFKSLLISYYEGENIDRIKQFFLDVCWRKF